MRRTFAISRRPRSPRLFRGLAALFPLVAVALLPLAAPAQKPTGGGMLAVTPTPTPVPSVPATTPADTRFQPPKVLKHPAPAYPELALLNRAEGVVTIRFGIDEKGRVSTVSIAKSGGSVMLDSIVLDYTLHDWTFEPATLDGKPIASSLEREFEFRLDPEEQRKLAEQRIALKEGLPDPPYPPEAIPFKLKGTCTVGVTWTAQGLVDLIYLDKGSGSNMLDRSALRWAFTHWRVDPKNIIYPKDKDGKDKPFTKLVTFNPPGPTPVPAQ